MRSLAWAFGGVTLSSDVETLGLRGISVLIANRDSDELSMPQLRSFTQSATQVLSLFSLALACALSLACSLPPTHTLSRLLSLSLLFSLSFLHSLFLLPSPFLLLSLSLAHFLSRSCSCSRSRSPPLSLLMAHLHSLT